MAQGDASGKQTCPILTLFGSVYMCVCIVTQSSVHHCLEVQPCMWFLLPCTSMCSAKEVGPDVEGKSWLVSSLCVHSIYRWNMLECECNSRQFKFGSKIRVMILVCYSCLKLPINSVNMWIRSCVNMILMSVLLNLHLFFCSMIFQTCLILSVMQTFSESTLAECPYVFLQLQLIRPVMSCAPWP